MRVLRHKVILIEKGLSSDDQISNVGEKTTIFLQYNNSRKSVNFMLTNLVKLFI